MSPHSPFEHEGRSGGQYRSCALLGWAERGDRLRVPRGEIPAAACVPALRPGTAHLAYGQHTGMKQGTKQVEVPPQLQHTLHLGLLALLALSVPPQGEGREAPLSGQE